MKQLRLMAASLLLVLMAVGLSSCNQNKPEDALLFTGKYTGLVTFSKLGDGALPIVDKDVEITVIKIGDNYSFRFSNKGIPAITGVKMKKGDNTLVTLEDDKGGLIKITGDELHIAYKNANGSWLVPSAKRK
ncbi:hypothetical protein [Porphyromonas levii]|uniref:Uncharacterized protein n=1 Tax=Porphyromonas levii TaxID=28114 RepID=A0A4Y8WRA8_9PORP|nr:hypothetical protein [Porphyromonas levii]MBR8704217.1 hypothetical protein [Porphyromonas levii]MBR8714140.1 hypothetical protein [Porphyromonas levii]MBR8716131.1 hypothetical protein [Porphyromonas levii]MBR8728669.1 hypothetical protein [Porphyromonas levii]MBR8730523.1 hypothetical protein [Porphyromonas levii]